MTKAQVLKAMKAAGIIGEVRGRGADVEVELEAGKSTAKFHKHVAKWGGFKTGYGAWILRPNYTAYNPHA